MTTNKEVSTDIETWSQNKFKNGSDIATYYRAQNCTNKGVEGLYHEGEEDLAKHGIWAFLYSFSILKGRFILDEEEMKETKWWNDYVEFLKKKGVEV